ncbi:BAHD acyltransferase DCR-like [Eucalyptus grandis]|nr:BAHD acyltransferase DCR-like [Eucalyptus grandis]
MTVNNRGRLEPPVPPEYYGNMVTPLRTAATVGELLDRGPGWAARQLHATVAEHNDVKLRKWNGEWIKSPHMYHVGRMFDPCNIMMWGSPRFNMYGNEFGLGKAVALQGGHGNKFDGKVSGYPGRDGGGSIDLEICLSPEKMAVLEDDAEFMTAVTVS